jgi:transcription initiation factor TFIIB
MQNSIVCSICKKDQTIITDLDSGEIVCSKCGVVISDKIQDTRQEWRDFVNSEEAKDRRRTGMPTSLASHDMGLYTMIGRGRKDARGQVLDASMRSTIGRLRTWDLRTQPSANKNLGGACNQLNTLKDKLGLPDVIIEKTAYLYRKALKKGLIRRSSIRGLLAATAYIACREMGAPRTLKEMSTVVAIKRKEISRSYRLLVLELDIRIPTVDPIKCIAIIANKTNVSEKTKRQAVNIMNEVTRREISAGKNPMGLAASVVYLLCLIKGDNISQSVFAHTAGVTEVSIRNICRNLRGQDGLFDLFSPAISR